MQVVNFAASFWGLVHYGGGWDVKGDQTEFSGYDVSIAWTQSPVCNSYWSSHRWSWGKKLFVIPVAQAYVDLVSLGQRVEQMMSWVWPAQWSDQAGEGDPSVRGPLGECLSSLKLRVPCWASPALSQDWICQGYEAKAGEPLCQHIMGIFSHLCLLKTMSVRADVHY